MDRYKEVFIKGDDLKLLRYEQGLRQDSTRIGITLICSHVAMLIFSYVLMSYLRVCGFYSIFNSDNGFSGYDPIAYYLASAAISVLSLAIPFLVLLKYISVDANKVLPFNRIGSGKKKLALIFLGMAVCTVAEMLASAYSGIAKAMGFPASNYEIDYSGEPMVVALAVVCTALLPALFEEFVFRGVILGTLRRYGDFTAVLISALLFGLIHSTIAQIPFALAVGVALGIITVKTNSLLPGIIIHFANNLIAVVNTGLIKSDNDGIAVLFYYATSLLFIIGGVYAVRYLYKKTDIFSIDNNTDVAISSKRRFFLIATAPGMLICAVVVIINVIDVVVRGGG